LKRRSGLEPVLRSFEFPGEEERLIRKWLDSRDFAGRVVDESRRLRVITHRSVLWAAALLVAVAAGAAVIGSPVVGGAGASVTTFTSVLMGALVTASIIGLLATLHPSWHRPPRAGRGPVAGGDAADEPATPD
jgi:hypothetical protein